MNKYLKVILIETIIVTIYVVSLYFYRTSTSSCVTDGPRCAFNDDLFMCSMIWVVIEIILIPISLLLTKVISIFIDIYSKK